LCIFFLLLYTAVSFQFSTVSPTSARGWKTKHSKQMSHNIYDCDDDDDDNDNEIIN